jgi:hypothetical protein
MASRGICQNSLSRSIRQQGVKTPSCLQIVTIFCRADSFPFSVTNRHAVGANHLRRLRQFWPNTKGARAGGCFVRNLISTLCAAARRGPKGECALISCNFSFEYGKPSFCPLGLINGPFQTETTYNDADLSSQTGQL